MRWTTASLLLLLGLWAAAAAPSTLDITVPESVKVEGEDSYICITKPLPDKPLKLVGVEPMAKQEVVHHILLFGEQLVAWALCAVAACAHGSSRQHGLQLLTCVLLSGAGGSCDKVQCSSGSALEGVTLLHCDAGVQGDRLVARGACCVNLRAVAHAATAAAAPQAVTSPSCGPRTARRQCGSASHSPHAAAGRTQCCEWQAGLWAAATGAARTRPSQQHQHVSALARGTSVPSTTAGNPLLWTGLPRAAAFFHQHLRCYELIAACS